MEWTTGNTIAVLIAGLGWAVTYGGLKQQVSDLKSIVTNGLSDTVKKTHETVTEIDKRLVRVETKIEERRHTRRVTDSQSVEVER